MSNRQTVPTGMTLIEVLVAVAILAVITTLIWQGMAQVFKNKARVEKRADRAHAIHAALDRMTQELSSAFVSVHNNPAQSLQVSIKAFVGKNRHKHDRVDFTSFSHRRLYRNAKESDQNEISYFVARHPDDSDIKVLARREQNRIDDKPQEGGETDILVEDIDGFELEYLDPQSLEWLDEWDTTQATGQPNRLPMQVKITLSVPDKSRGKQASLYGTRVSLPITWALNHSAYTP